MGEEVSARELRDAMTHLATDFAVGSPGHPSESDIEQAALAMLRAPLPVPFTKDEDELGRIFYYNASTGRSEWRHPLEGYYRGWLFMHKARGIERTHERLKEAPETPEELREMAEFLKVDVRKEFPLLESVREALHAPLPFGWKEVHETNARERYVHTETKNGSIDHPLDAYFRERISRRRKEARAYSRASSAVSLFSESLAKSHLDVSRRSVPRPWLEFIEPRGGGQGASTSGGETSLSSSSAHGGLFWYNFSTNECSYVHPAQVSVQALSGESSISQCGRDYSFCVVSLNLSRREIEDSDVLICETEGYLLFAITTTARSCAAVRRRCAVLLQALARGRLERDKIRRIKFRRAVHTIEAAWLLSRARRLEKTSLSSPTAASAVAANSSLLQPNLAQIRRNAAITIQRFWRGFSTRKHLEDEKQIRRIIRVQSVWRGGQCRQQLHNFLAAGQRGLDLGKNIVADGVAASRKRIEKLVTLCDGVIEVALFHMS